MNTITAIAIYPDNRVVEQTVDSLGDLQEIVGGLIQPVDLADGSTMYVNEEFLYTFGPEDSNWIASDVAGIFGGRYDLMLTGIRGPVVVVGPVDKDGYHIDVTEQARRKIRRSARQHQSILQRQKGYLS